jgi:hypothetical protein
VLPVLYKLHEGSNVSTPSRAPTPRRTLRTGISHAAHQVAFEIDQLDPAALEGWTMLVVWSAHHVDSDAERASIIHTDVEPWPEAEP